MGCFIKNCFFLCITSGEFECLLVSNFCLLLLLYTGKIALTDSGIMFLSQGFQVKGENSAFAGYTVK